MVKVAELTINIRADVRPFQERMAQVIWQVRNFGFLLAATREDRRRLQLRADLDRQGALPVPLRAMLAKWLPGRWLPTYATQFADYRSE